MSFAVTVGMRKHQGDREGQTWSYPFMKIEYSTRYDLATVFPIGTMHCW
jgi:hypothetical protein